MNALPVWLQISLTLASGGFFGSLVSLIISPVAARQQIKQLEVTYRHKLNDNLIENAKQYRDTLYIPIYKSLFTIEERYQAYKNQKKHLKSFKREKVTILNSDSLEDKVVKFKGIYTTYQAATEQSVMELFAAYSKLAMLIESIAEEGNDIHLPLEFENRLHAFRNLSRIVGNDDWMLKLGGVDIESDLKIDSKRFEKIFFADIRYLRSYIKAIAQGTSNPAILSPQQR